MAALAALVTLSLSLILILTQDDINLVDESISNLLLEALSTGAPPAPRPTARPHRKTAWRLPGLHTPSLASPPPTVTPPSPPPLIHAPSGWVNLEREGLSGPPLSKEDALMILRMHVPHPPPRPHKDPPPPPTPHVTCAAMPAPQRLIAYLTP